MIAYDKWMKDTHSLVKPRSESLKKIDEALKKRDEAAAKRALVNWIDEQNKKKQNWHKSVRNEKGAVLQLYKDLKILGNGPTFGNIGAEMDDQLAKAHMKREMRLAAAKMFAGKEMRFKPTFWGIYKSKCADNASKAKRAAAAIKTGAHSTAGVGRNVADVGSSVGFLAKDLTTVVQAIMGDLPAATHNAIIEQVFGSTVEQFVFSVMPLFGVVSSGAQAVKDWIGVAMNVHEATKMEAAYGDVRPGDAAASLQAIVAIIDRQIKKQAVDGAIRTTAFSAKGIGVLADGGTATTAAIGAIESIALLLNALVDLVIDARQMVAANKLIQEDKIDIELFNVCPILGCYYIAIQDHSTIMNFEVANMGRENWQQEALRLRYAIDPVLKKARELVNAARIEIPGMENAKGVYESTFLQKLKLAVKSF